MNYNIYFNNEKLLDDKIEFLISKKQLIKIEFNEKLISAHLDKSKHNLQFFNKNKDDSNFNDWLIVTLYYALYHGALALLIKKGYTSKNHTATLLFLIKNYSISIDEINLLNELLINKKDAQLYTDLKFERHNASYSTNIIFSKEKIKYYRNRVIEFIQKVEDIINNKIIK